MTDDWKPRPADRVVRHPREDEIGPIRLTVTTRKFQSSYLTSPLIIVYVFAALAIIGTLLLLLPFANTDGRITPLMVAFFTATSAVTLTGLTVQETAVYWTFTGQLIIMSLTFISGLAFMSLATFLLLIIGQRMALADRFLVIENTAVNQLNGLFKLMVSITIVAVVIQLVGFVALFIRFLFIYAPVDAIWQAVFHSVSAFNNAGFSTLREPGGLAILREDKIFLSIISMLVILGGFGYLIVMDVVKFKRFRLFALNTKLVLVFTIIMIVFGTLGIFAFEYQNPKTLGPEGIGEKVSESLFQTIIGRTAGFGAIDLEETRKQTDFFFTFLMFIGGASASTAGGIKINTFAAIMIAIVSTTRGVNRPSAFGRDISRVQVWRAMVIGVLATAFVFATAWLLVIFEEGVIFIDLFFETVSAFGTVGLSTGITPDLSVFGKIVLMVAMFVGRTGPIVVGLWMASRAETETFRYAQESVTIG